MVLALFSDLVLFSNLILFSDLVLFGLVLINRFLPQENLLHLHGMGIIVYGYQ